MTKREKFVLWLNKFYHVQNKITICVLYVLIMAILGVVIYGANQQKTSGEVSVTYSRPSYTVSFDPAGGGVSPSSKTVKLGENYGDLPTPTRTGYTFSGWKNGDISVTASTQNTTVGDHTLTAQWTPNNYNIIFYENKNILVGGEFAKSKDISQNWENYNSGASVTTVDSISCSKYSGELSKTQYVSQSILGRIKYGTEYIVSLKFKLTDYVAGTTNAFVAIYMSGYYDNNGTSTWFSVGLDQSLTGYNNAGWTDLYYHGTTNSQPTSDTATGAWAHIYARDFTGELDFCNYSIAEATHATRTVTYDSSPGGATVLSYSGTVKNGDIADYPFGYNFQGYYTQPVGGTKIFNADGSVVANVSGYTNASGNWVRAAETKLYAQWKQWSYIPSSAKATFVNTQALQDSSGGRGKRVVQVTSTQNSSGATRRSSYRLGASGSWSNSTSNSYIVTKTATGDEKLYVRVFPNGEKYMGFISTSTTVHLNKLPVPQTQGYLKKGISGRWHTQAKRMVANTTMYVKGCDCNECWLTSYRGYATDEWICPGSWDGWIASMLNTYYVYAYHALNGFVDSDVQSQRTPDSSATWTSGSTTYYTAQDDGTITS